MLEENMKRPIRGTNAFAKERWTIIHNYSLRGYTEVQIAELIGVSPGTVKKYLSKKSEEIGLDIWDKKPIYKKYRPVIVEQLKINPKIKIATLMRILCEYFEIEEIGIRRQTFTRFVRHLKEGLGIEEPTYENRPAHRVPDDVTAAMAFVDMGQKKLIDMYGNEKKVYFWIIVLGFSRMKFAYFLDRPFQGTDFVIAHELAFKYFDGVPREIAYDQDRVMVFAENRGDVVYQEDFANYIKKTKFKIYLCRGHDPRSKGKVENAVAFVKHNFLDAREYRGIDNLNQACLEWLDKIGNEQLHAVTKESPKKLFIKEKPHLYKYRPYEMDTKKQQVLSVSNLYDVCYKKNIYSVPFDFCKPHDRVLVEESGNLLLIYTLERHELIASHKLIKGVGGMSIQAQKPDHFLKSAVEIFKTTYPFYKDFLDGVMEEVPRYFYDQFIMLKEIIKRYGEQRVKNAICIAMKKNLYSVPKVLEMLAAADGEEMLRHTIAPRLVKHYMEQGRGYSKYTNFVNDGMDKDREKVIEANNEDELEKMIDDYNKRLKSDEVKLQEEFKRLQALMVEDKKEEGEN